MDVKLSKMAFFYSASNALDCAYPAALRRGRRCMALRMSWSACLVAANQHKQAHPSEVGWACLPDMISGDHVSLLSRFFA